jgi:two-component system response regulator YesN
MSTILEYDTDLLPPSEKHVVVVLEDDPGTLSALVRLLGHEPYELRATLKPYEALEWIARREVSLLVSDYIMSDMSGLDMVESVKKLAPGTTCVLLTAYADRIRLQQRWRSSIRELIEKPWDARTLRNTIRHLLRERELQAGRLSAQEGE